VHQHDARPAGDPADYRAEPGAEHRGEAGLQDEEDDRRERDRANILSALEVSRGKVFGRGGAAELLDIKATTLAARIKALGIRYERKPKEKPRRG
jgi:transcriptional regulator with GAF, ATPase, and Fis domain